MKKYISFAIIAVMAILSSCNDYIDIMPKGSRIPATLADYEALLRNEYNCNYLPALQATYLINDKFIAQNTCRNVDNLNTANYMWKESADRAALNSSTEDVFDYGYGIIGIVNIILENVPETTDATQAEKDEVMAYCHAIRAFVLHQIVCFYADAYDPATAAQTPGIPLIFSGNLGSPWHQGSVKEVYDQILADFNKALELGVPERSMTVVHPCRAAVEAGLARVYLHMRDYDKALAHAEEALSRKDDLFDWTEYYSRYREQIEDPDNYTRITSPMDATCCENIWFCNGNGNPNYPCADIDIPSERRDLFEAGDAKALVRFKKYTSSSDTYFRGMLSGYYNLAGITTPEVMCIKGECLARSGRLSEAMNTLDRLRATRILPEVYRPSSASDVSEAVSMIRQWKANELINSIFPFMDLKRLNAEGSYPVTLSKTFDGKAYTLAPSSHLWTMVFPANSINRPGNGSLTQNSK